MARRDPWVNMLRTTIACAGAALGGADADHCAALHLGHGQARCVRPPHRPQHASGAAGGKLARPRRRPGARRLVHREDDRGAGAQELGAVPGRSRPRAAWPPRSRAASSRSEVAKVADARAPQHCHRPAGADGRLRVSAARRRWREGGAASPARAGGQGRDVGHPAACRGGWRSPSSACAMPPMSTWRGRASVRRCSSPVSATSPPTRCVRPGSGISWPPAASTPSSASRC